ncbi:hypothetical protein GF325_13855 [Candidatus Bathyarchaeota archaeon]|nr:hypothetical protein [Candidatus Bathyarchaeota archaeon]
MILGDMGIKILEVLRFGPMDMQTINFLSGVPVACIKGRIPVLKSLKLVKEDNNLIILDTDGKAFLEDIGSKGSY